ncbi:MAG: cyclic nucleotide-binding domain-containing protein [Spirochaetales bacterium]|nr:cyclic nucleotide-binding domain-containing protein [Spirochaetales bacterium]
MRKIAVLNTDSVLNEKIKSFCSSYQDGDFDPFFLSSEEQSLEYLNYELPELSVYNFSDKKLNTMAILKKVKSDPWLHYGGIIGLHDLDKEHRVSEMIKDSNIVSLIPISRFDFSFPRVLKAVRANRQIIFQRHIQAQFLTNLSGSFVLDNDPFDVVTYAHLVTNYLFNSNYINIETKEGLNVALTEMLMNAIEHGNCKISFQEKSRWLNSGADIFDLIRLKNKDPEVNSKKVHFSYRITPTESHFVIRDEGEGFDWRVRKEKLNDASPIDLHGRGILMAGLYVQELEYNEAGNEVRFRLEHLKFESNVLPGAFTQVEEIVFNDGDIICHEGEESNYLYYIVSGKLDILSRGKVISYLTPADIFLGEMSFLLNNKRSATVRANGKCVLLNISKESFLSAIKKNPHYGVFLARLLAQRLDRLNQQSADLLK